MIFPYHTIFFGGGQRPFGAGRRCKAAPARRTGAAIPPHTKKVLASKWHYAICNQKPSEWREVLVAPPLWGGATWGGGQPAGLAAAPARGRRPPKAGGGPTKYHQLALRNSSHRASHLPATLLGGRVVLLSAQVASY